MSIIDDVILPEYYRLIDSIKYLEEKISDFPKGAVRNKQIKGRDYIYLTYRDGKKVKSRYIGSASSKKAVVMLSQLKKRNRMQDQLKELKVQLKDCKKVLGGKV